MLTMIAFIVLFQQARRLGSRAVKTIQLLSIIILAVFGAILIKEGITG
jgi:hypothetical protein